MTRILVAGAGYLGQAFAKLNESSEVTLARRSRVEVPGMNSYACDFSDPSTLKGLPEVDLVYYAASADEGSDEAYEKAYEIGLRNLVDHYKARAVRPAFFYSSSTSVYEESAGGECFEDAALVKSGSSRFMVSGEKLLLDSVLEATVLRYGGIYGPGRNAFVQRIKDRLEKLTPESVRYMNRIHQCDAVEMINHLYAKGETGVFNAVDQEPSIRDDVILWVVKELGLSPSDYPKGDAPMRGHRRVYSNKLQRTGYKYRVPSYREGYESLVEELRLK